MIWAAVDCLAACVAVCLLAPRLGPLVQPALATRILGTTAVATAIALFWVAVLGAGTLLAQIPVVARAGEWSPELLAAADPVPRWAALGCLVMAIRALVLGARTIGSQLTGLLDLRRTLNGLPAAGSLTVIDDPRGVAFATPARGGRIVVSTGMLRALEPDERRALLAHESAHVRHGHYWWVAAARVSAAICPMLRATARGVAQSAERWADEDAATRLGDRMVVARAVARAALHTSAAASPRGSVAAADGHVVRRVEAMLRPPPRRRLAPALLLVSLLALSSITAWKFGEHTDTLFDRAPADAGAAIPAP
jgi:Zn-dependent protease with chaperone function